MLIPFVKIQAAGFLIVMGLMLITWVFSVIKKNAGIVDVVWGISFVVISVFYYFNSSGNSLRKFTVLVLIILWGLRLSIHIFFRNRGKGEDFRYAAFRKKAGPARYWWYSFFQVFLLQGFLSALISAPVLGAMINTGRPFPGIFDILGIILWTIGFVFETIGDLQLQKFKSDSSNRGKLLTSGLWRYTRHPNYFGDSAVWWGYACFSLGAGLVAPVYGSLLMTYLLLKVSGVSLLEKTLMAGKAGYEDYQKSTSAFFPWFPGSSTSNDR